MKILQNDMIWLVDINYKMALFDTTFTQEIAKE